MNQPKSKTLCLYFQLHQPIRLNLTKSFENPAKKNEIYSNSKNSQTNNSRLPKSDLADSSQNLLSSFPFDDFFVGPSGDNPDFLYGNSTIFDKVAATSYIPGLQFWLKQLKQFPDLKLTLGLSGTFLEQMEKSQFGVEILTLIRQLLATNRLEILAETYYHSLASLVSQVEFGRQIQKHSDILQRLLGYNPTSFRNTELIFNSQIGQMVESLGYKVQIISQPKKLRQNPLNQFLNSQNSDPIPNLQDQSLQNQNSQSPVFSKNPKKVQVAKVPNLTILGKITTDSQNSQNLAISNSQKKSEWKNEKNLDLGFPNLEKSQNLQSQFSNPKSSKIVFSSLNSSQLLAAQINPNLPAFSVLTNKNPKTPESSSKIKLQNQNSPQNSQNLSESQILQQNPQEYFQKSYKSEELESSFESKNNSHLKLALANFEATMFFFFTHRSQEFKQFFEDFDGNLEVLGTDFEIFGEHNGSHIFEIWSDLLRTLEPNWNFATVSDLATFESAELEKEIELKNTRQTNLERQGNQIKITKNLSNLAPGSVLDSVSNSFSSPILDLISDSNLPIYQDIFENKITSWTNSEQSLISWLGNNNQDKSFEKLGQIYIKLQKLSQKLENPENEITPKEKFQNKEKVENYQDNLANNLANSTDIFSLNSKNQKDVSKKFENSSQNHVEKIQNSNADQQKTKNYSQELEKVDLSYLVTGNIINLETKNHTFLETYKSLENSSNQNQPHNLEKTNSIKPNQNNQNSTKINLDKVWDFFGKLSTSDNFYYMSDLAEPDGLLHAMFNAYPSPQIAFETYWQILEIFENFLDNLRFYADLE